MTSHFSNKHRKYVLRKKPMIPDSTLIDLLRKFRHECKDQDLSVECAMASTLIATARFDIALRDRPIREWLGMVGLMRSEMRNLIHALKKEYGVPDNAEPAEEIQPEVSQ